MEIPNQRNQPAATMDTPEEDTLEHRPHKLSEILDDVFDESRGASTFGELVDRLDHHGLALILVLFSIPSALPIPAAGYSTLLSIPLLAIGGRLILGRDTVWLPEKMRLKEFRPENFRKLKNLMLKVVTFIERFSKPRLTFFTRSVISRVGLGLLICLLGAFMAVPVPLTNTLPAGGIFLIGFGLLEDDGLLVGLGVAYSFAALGVAVLATYLLLTVGESAIEELKTWIKGLVK